MQLSEVFSSRAVALNATEAATSRDPFLGQAFFPDRKKMGIDLKWIKTHKGLGVALKPSNFDAIPTIRPRGGVQMTKEEMPFFRESMNIKEHDLIELARIKETNDPFLQPVLDSIYDDTNNLVEGAEVSAERMRMQLLAPVGGKMQITIGMADNTLYTYDYDEGGVWSKEHFVECRDTATWDKSDTAKPLSDIRKGVQYLAGLGITATSIISNSATFDYLLENKQVQNALLSITGQAITYVDDASVEEVIRRKLKLDWIVYDKMYVDYDGKQKKFYPDDYVTIVGNGQLGNTWRGTTPEELTLIGGFMDLPKPPVDITVMENGVAVAVQTKYEPSFQAITTASQIALPSYEGMDGVYVIKVK